MRRSTVALLGVLSLLVLIAVAPWRLRADADNETDVKEDRFRAANFVVW